MGAEIFDVEIKIDDVSVVYATKVSSSKNKDTNTTLTFNGDVSTSAGNTGGTISVEGLYFPSSVQDAIDLENKLNEVDAEGNPSKIQTVTCTGTSYTAEQVPYTRTIIGTGVTVTSDEDEWSPSDGISQTLEFAVDNLTRFAEHL